MKYYHDIRTINNYTWDAGYDVNKLLNKDLYGFAYEINDDTKDCRLSCRPVLGTIIYEGGKIYYFVPYKKGTQELRKSGRVLFESRMYADTYNEAVEMYNELVQKRIEKLKEMIQEAEKDKIQ